MNIDTIIAKFCPGVKYKFVPDLSNLFIDRFPFTACAESCIIKMTSFLHKEGRRSMTIYQLECFIAVAEELNFQRRRRAAVHHQPAITYQINALEKETGLRLFRRTTRRTKLTAARAVLLSGHGADDQLWAAGAEEGAGYSGRRPLPT